MLSAIKALILVLLIGVVIYKISFIETREYTTNFSQIVSLKGLDENVVAELRTNESFHRESEKILWQGIPLGRAVADISLIANFKYFVKLRELTLGFNFPESFYSKLNINNLSLSVIGRNLWIIHKNTPYSDPEAGLGSGNIQGYQSGAYPAVKEIGASLKFEF